MTAVLVACLTLLAGGPAGAQLAPSPPPHREPSPATSPLPPPGERDPLVGAAAVAAIVVVAGAGLWVYRVIRRGL